MVAITDIVLPDRFNATSVFLDHNLEAGRGAKTAIYYEGTAYSYAEVAELANRMGNALLDLGVDVEQRVALLLLDSPQFAATFFGAIKIGAVPTPLNTNLLPGDYIPILNESRARVLVIHAAVWKQIVSILPQIKPLRHVVVVGLEQEGLMESATLHYFETVLMKASGILEAAETTRDDSAFWLYSSGSTGFPKAAFTCSMI